MVLSHAHCTGSTYIRYQRIWQLLRGKAALTQADLEAFTRDHAGYPTSVCAHPSTGTPPEKLSNAGGTNYAFVADLAHDRLRFVMGNPCEGTYEDLEI